MINPKKNTNNIFCIIVTYEPSFDRLKEQIISLEKQVNKIIIVDNNSSNIEDFNYLHSSINFVKLNHNYGIAYAQNQGMIKALQEGAKYILLMDQDSKPSNDMVEELALGFVNDDVIAAGPCYIDSRNGRKSFFVVDNKGRPKRVYSTVKPIEAAFLISSGTLINVNSLLKVNGKRSDYFIDHVDTEWTFRAREKGYKLMGMPNAIMYHSLGDEVKNVWFFGNRQVSYHSPLRDYYMFRNTILMMRDTQMNWMWKMHFLWRLIQFFIYFIIFSSNKKDRFIKMVLGIWHGAHNIRGKLILESSKPIRIPLTNLDP